VREIVALGKTMLIVRDGPLVIQGMSVSKLLTILIAFASSLAWFALGVLGWGGLAFFAHPARVALVVVGVALFAAAMLSEGGLRRGEREDRHNHWIFVPVFVLGIASGWLSAYCDRTGLLTLDGNWLRWLGVVLFAVGGVLRIVPVFVLGRRFSGLVAIQPGHTLVTTGIYGTIRHPRPVCARSRKEWNHEVPDRSARA
jgi:isoprenylcysteine carboxyl methyltransferase (ICMT) family protein YpbQ